MPLPQYRQSSFIPPVTKGAKWLIIVNSALFVLQYAGGGPVQRYLLPLYLTPDTVVHNFAVWQLVTYMFFHGGVWHLIFNMLALWMFGSPLEQDWGTRRFLKFYFLAGIVAGLCDVGLHAVLRSWNTNTIGASGAIYGLLAAFGTLYPEVMVIFLIFPMKAKHMVLIFAAAEFVMTLGPDTGVSSIAHLGGMAFGYLYLKRSLPRIPLPDWQGAYRQWRMGRAKKKFQVYMRNRGGRGPWVN